METLFIIPNTNNILDSNLSEETLNFLFKDVWTKYIVKIKDYQDFFEFVHPVLSQKIFSLAFSKPFYAPAETYQDGVH